MKKISIDTTQNVKIEYELAALKDRVLAYLLDVLTMVVGIVVITLILSFSGVTLGGFLPQFVSTIIILFYTPVFEILSGGQTLGKIALNTKTVKITGKKPKAIDFITRWAFRCVDIYGSAGAIAGVLVTTTDKAQRIGGMVSNTAVVRLDPKMHLSLNQLLSIDTIDKYKPKHLRITLLNDKDMLIVKNVLERCVKYSNKAHFEVLKKTLLTIEEKTGIKCDTANKFDFLKTLLKDYIVLTR
ncbi:MAG: RDD family protein [Flavobacteriales bacterium]|nr:RDD family protein [Flavobacteriales bacterium]